MTSGSAVPSKTPEGPASVEMGVAPPVLLPVVQSKRSEERRKEDMTCSYS